MSSLKDALSRVARAAQRLDLPKAPANIAFEHRVPSPEPSTRPRVDREKLAEIRPYLRGHQKSRYREFLKPLDMPQLKIYDSQKPKYNLKRAEANLKSKTKKDHVGAFQFYLGERQIFTKMLDFLVELTPAHMKSKETVENPDLLARTLRNEEDARPYKASRYTFHEVPPIPDNLSKDRFHEYIYYLTHLRMLFRNSSSLSSGIVPEILLYTHLLDNEAFKPFRSTDTYNCLIKFFGHDKFQSSFAKELLLVLAKDGHQPNLETFNILLKICKLHTKRRSLTSTYSVIISYLNLIKRLGYKVNLTTWNRVYDCIDNLYLKEMFVNKMTTLNLPVLENMCVRILEDFSTTTNNTSEVTEFIVKTLRRPLWKSDCRYVNKVLYHMVLHSEDAKLEEAWDLLETCETNGVTAKAMLNAIGANKMLRCKELMLGIYCRIGSDVLPETVSKLLCVYAQSNADILHSLLVIRGLIADCVQLFGLPTETLQFKHASEPNPHPHVHKFPYQIPKGDIPESYRLLKRLTQHNLTDFEAKTLIADCETMPWQPLSECEKEEWKRLKMHYAGDFWLDPKKEPENHTFNKDEIAAYRSINTIRMGISHDINLIHRILAGYKLKIEDDMARRGIYAVPRPV